MTQIEFTAHGTPAPKGSKRAVRNRYSGKAMLIDDNGDKPKAWAANVAACAAEAMRGKKLMTGPVQLWVGFAFARPKCHYRTGKRSGELRPDAPTCHTNKPDKDKLMRCLCDAMTGIVYRDDCQIWMTVEGKVWSDNGAYAIVTVSESGGE